MKITNKSTRIIHIGHVTILPDETAQVDDTSRMSPAVDALLKKKDIIIDTSKSGKTGKTGKAKAADKATTEPTKAPEDPPEDPNTTGGSQAAET